MNKVVIIGGGSWGTAIGHVLSKNVEEVFLWLRDKNQVDNINDSNTNEKYLPGVKLENNIIATNDIEFAVKNSQLIVLAVPTHTVYKNLVKIKNIVKEDQIIVNLAKGIENDSLLRISEIVGNLLPKNPYVMLSGPSHAEEVALDDPTTVIVASNNKKAALRTQDLFMTKYFRVYTNDDLIGVELGGALKNVIALGAGISDGLNYGDNAKAALINRGIFEMARLGKAMGGKTPTFLGLSGIGDLIVTCTSTHSRNRKAGYLIGQGYRVEDAIEEVGMIVEGIKTTKSAYELSKIHKVNMPITEEIYNVLYKGYDVRESVEKLMTRAKKSEMEDLF